MALKRVRNWDSQEFDAFLSARKDMPFLWGGNDCALFAADGIKVITGEDIAADFRGKYTDEAGAMAAIKSVCGGTTVADAAVYCAGKVGLVELAHPLKAQRGDLVVLKDGGGLIAGLVGLAGYPVAVGEAGLKRLALTAIQRAWHY